MRRDNTLNAGSFLAFSLGEEGGGGVITKPRNGRPALLVSKFEKGQNERRPVSIYGRQRPLPGAVCVCTCLMCISFDSDDEDVSNGLSHPSKNIKIKEKPSLILIIVK